MMIRIEFEKFCNHNLGKWFKSNDKKLLVGYFKEPSSDFIVEEEFMAYELQKGSALDVYKCYIDYFNYTRDEWEKCRIAVKAKWKGE